MARPVLIDTDTGVDDALALIMAFASPEIRVEAITTVAGNVGVHLCTRNAQYIAWKFGGQTFPPVFRGASKPLRRPKFSAPEVHGNDGLGNILTRHPVPKQAGINLAVDAILTFCEKHGKRGTIVAIGPLTNLALALKRGPSILGKIGRIVSMGGAFRVPGNTGPVAEFNYFADPEAAHMVMQSGLPLTVVPLDVTEQLVVRRRELLSPRTISDPVRRRFLSDLTREYMAYHRETEGFTGGYLHDPLAIGVAIAPDIVRTKALHVAVETSSDLTRGMTVAGFRQGTRQSDPLVRVALEVDVPRFIRLFYQRISG